MLTTLLSGHSNPVLQATLRAPWRSFSAFGMPRSGPLVQEMLAFPWTTTLRWVYGVYLPKLECSSSAELTCFLCSRLLSISKTSSSLQLCAETKPLSLSLEMAAVQARCRLHHVVHHGHCSAYCTVVIPIQASSINFESFAVNFSCTRTGCRYAAYHCYHQMKNRRLTQSELCSLAEKEFICTVGSTLTSV